MILYSSKKPKREFTPNYVSQRAVKSVSIVLSEKDYDKFVYKAAADGFNVSGVLKSLVQNYINNEDQ